MVTYGIPILLILIAAVAEYLHVRRCRRLAYLAFGPTSRPRAWTAAAAPLRVLSLGLLCWSLIVLLQIDSSSWDELAGSRDANKNPHHLVIGIDVSPSMKLEDAGPGGKQPRGDRGRDVLRSILDRLDATQTRISVVAFYSSARPVVIDTVDMNVVTNILDDLPLEYAFETGKTNMYSCVDVAAEVAKKWPARSATLVIISDGDTLPPEEIKELPRAYASSLVMGVGNRYRGKQIDDHSSRQDGRSLEQLALRLRGGYHDVNEKHLPTERLRKIVASLSTIDTEAFELRDAALWAIGISASVLAFLPVALGWWGTAWHPQSASRSTFSPAINRLLDSKPCQRGNRTLATPRIRETENQL